MPEVISDDPKQAAQYWQIFVRRLKMASGVREEVISYLSMMTQPEGIGFDQDQVRPGEIGRWDVFYMGQELGWTENERYLASGLTRAQVHKEERDDEIRDMGLDPKNPEDVKCYEQLRRLTPAGAEGVIRRLEAMLASKL